MGHWSPPSNILRILKEYKSVDSSPHLFSLPQKTRLCYVDLNLAAAAAKSLQSCPTLCDPIDGSPPGSPIPGILQARTLEWVAISFSNAWKWKVKGKSLVVSDSLRPHGLQPTRLLSPWDLPGKSTGVECHCLLPKPCYCVLNCWFCYYMMFLFLSPQSFWLQIICTHMLFFVYVLCENI